MTDKENFTSFLDFLSLSLFFHSLFLFFTVEFMGNDIKSPVHKSLHPMYVSYASIPTGSASTTQLNSKHTINPNQFGVVLTSINSSNNTNSLSSTYIKSHNNNINSNNNTPSSLNNTSRRTQSPTHFQLIDHRQLSNSSNLSQYNSRNNLISKSASTQQIIKRNPSFNNSGTNRSDIRYTEIISTADDIFGSRDEKDVDTNSTRSYFMPSSTASTAVASPITTNKLIATNLQQQQLISRSFGIQQNPLNNLLHETDEEMKINDDIKGQVMQTHSPVNTKNHPRHDSNSNGKCQSIQKNRGYQVSSPDKYACVSRSPNLNHMPRRRPLPPIPQDDCPPIPISQVSTSQISIASPVNVNRPSGTNFCDQIRDKPVPMRYNLNQFIPEYNLPNPLPAIPPHMFQHPMYRVRSQDRIGNRLKRQSGPHAAASPHENQRPRSFCNNAINYQDYKDLQP